MALNIRIAARRDFKSKDLWEMHKLRAKVFKDRLGWEVPLLSGMEIDGYDALEDFVDITRPVRGPLTGQMQPAFAGCRSSRDPGKTNSILATLV